MENKNLIICAFMLGFSVGGLLTLKMARIVAIERNAAHYDAKTGAFTWNDERIEK